MKYVFSCLSTLASQQFKEPDAKYLAVSGFLYLRFFCPAILNPKLFGMASEHPDGPLVGRTLTLVAKVIQNLANLVDFGKKEPHMIPFNPFIKKNINLMKAIIDKMSVSG
jgi:hypothetical protein